MGAMFRSEEMVLAQLFIQEEAAYPTISELGEIGKVQFRDLNEDVNAFHRNFVNEVRRCDEMERQLKYIEKEMDKDEVALPEIDELPRAPNPRESIDLEAHLDKTEEEIKGLSDSAYNMKSDYLRLTELKHLLENMQSFIVEQEGASGFGDASYNALIGEDAREGRENARGLLEFIAGVVPKSKVAGFERMLWRVCRGNVFMRQADIEEKLEDPTSGAQIDKTCFVIFYQGFQLKDRIKKISTGFHATVYQCGNTPAERTEQLKNVCTKLEDFKIILNQNEDHRKRVLYSVAKEVPNWDIMVRKMKAIYHTLNCCSRDSGKRYLLAECWIPVDDVETVRQTLTATSNTAGSTIPSILQIIETNDKPPTFNRTNKFTQGFQNLIDSYGVASYREINPALYTTITFPFLFAIMFGDAGHGLILTLLGTYMVVYEVKLGKIKQEIWQLFFGGRYIILLMGIFSIYTGIIYNDVFSKSMNLFGSSWLGNVSAITGEEIEIRGTDGKFTLNPRGDFIEEPYEIGVDPIWQLAKNKIIFLNTYKMKLSIIFGVAHMIFGVCMSVCNYAHFHKIENVLLDFVPQILFLVCLFFWMVVMMFLKFFMYSAETDGKYGTYCAPSVLIMFINMMLFKEGSPFPGCEEFMFDGQKYVQMALVAVALACIPVMLFAKPVYIILKKKKGGATNEHGDGEHEEEEPLSEIFIHQAIHTIEYVLSTVSHTASYLRLWALSLAHAQLSEVLWNMILQMSLTMDGYVGAVAIYLLFAAWAVLTVGILVSMEGLSAFLHTLRLHWVEFMSKFYEGLGYAFQPFSFKAIMEAEEFEELG